jgi:hypothetical protein
MTRILGSTITPRGQASSLSKREAAGSSSDRAVESAAEDRTDGRSLLERAPRAVAAGGVTVQYVDRYIYVDGSMTTATVFEMSFSWGDATPAIVFSLLSGAIIAEVNVWMLDPFDGVNPSITIGRSGAVDELMNVEEVDPTFVSSYATRPGKEYGVGEDVTLYITPGAGNTQGRGVLSIYII